MWNITTYIKIIPSGNCGGITNKIKQRKSYRIPAVALLEAAGVEPASCSEVT